MAGEPDRIVLSSAPPDTGRKLNPAPARRRLGTVFRTLTEPAPSVEGREPRQRARTTSALMGAMAVSLGVAILVKGNPSGKLPHTAFLFTLAYVLSRTRYPVAGAVLGVGSLYYPVVTDVIALSDFSVVSVFFLVSWLAIPVTLGALLFPLGSAVLVIVGTHVLLMALPTLVPGLEYMQLAAGQGLITAVSVISLVVSSMQHRYFMEQEREEARIKASLDEKEVLLKEIHHRVKNNLQIVSSLLSLQGGSADDKMVSDALRDCQDRVQTIALIHERLYQAEDLVHLDFGTYVRALTAGLVASQSKNPGDITLNVAIDDVFLGPDEAILCGLIVNELVTNALKHGFPNGGKGEVNVAMHRAGDDVELTICNDGLPFPDDVNILQVESLGLHLVISLVSQLGGTLSLTTGDHTCFTIACCADIAHWKGG